MSLRQVLESRASAQLLRRTSFPPEDALQIFSSPRGGSTWLMSLLSKLPGVAGLWEPFHEAKGVVPPHWGARPHPEALRPNGQSILEGVLSGQRTNAWTCSRTSFTEARHASQLLVKYVRGNALLPYMLDTWRFTHAPLLLMRHPLDVVTSQVRAFGARPRDLDVHRAYPGHATLHARWDDIRHVEDPVERQLHMWCLLNAQLWETMAQDDRVVALHYHDLILDPERHLKAVLEQWNWAPKDPDPSWSIDAFVSGLDLRATSDTDFKGDFLANQQDQLWKNIKRLTPEERARYQRVLDTHSFTLYAMDEVSPQLV